MVFQMPERGGSRPPRGPRLGVGVRGGRRGLLLRTAAAAFLLSAVLTAASLVWTDRIRYREAGYGDVWNTMLWTKLLLFAVFGSATALLVGLNAWLAYRLRSPLSAMSEEQRSLERYRQAVCRHRGRALAAVALLPGLAAGATASGAWQTWLAFDHSTAFGDVDPQFHRDISFYVFRMPWYRFLVGFGFTALVVTLAVTALVHYLYGSIQAQAGRRHFACAARGHLGVLLGLFVALKASAYWLDRYDPAANGTTPAKTILCCAAAICAVLFLLAPLRRNWTLPMTGLGLMAVSSVLIGSVYPALVQQFQVKSEAKAKERPLVQRTIAATRTAYGIAGTGGATSHALRLPAGPASAAPAAVPSPSPAPVPAPSSSGLSPQQRVRAVAPWLSLDGDVCAVAVEGGTEWVVDGYTTSDDYPYAARTVLGSAAAPGSPAASTGTRQVNYVRDSVKATVDATSGVVTLYQWDRTDPVLSTWMKAFPGTVRPYAEIDAQLKQGMCHPTDLLKVRQRLQATLAAEETR